jgi:hypothetical protein
MKSMCYHFGDVSYGFCFVPEQIHFKVLFLPTMFGILEMYEGIEDTKGLIRIRLSKRNRQYNGQKKINKRTNDDLQNIHKIKERVTRTPGVNSDAPEG